MRVCYFYATAFDEALAALPASAELVDTGKSPNAYWQELKKRWTGKEDLLVIEQDITIHDSVVSQLESCKQDWCLFPYLYGRGNAVNLSGPQFMTTCLGCTRFSAKLQKAVPLEKMFDNPKAIFRRQACVERLCTDTDMCWRHIDQVINQTLELTGRSPHWHMPMVDHGHYVNVVPPVYAPAPPEDEMVEMVLQVRKR